MHAAFLQRASARVQVEPPFHEMSTRALLIGLGSAPGGNRNRTPNENGPGRAVFLLESGRFQSAWIRGSTSWSPAGCWDEKRQSVWVLVDPCQNPLLRSVEYTSS